MDKLNLYRHYIQELLTERAKLRAPNDPVESETIFDTTSDHYQLVNVGWKDSSTRVYSCILHVDIKDGKIWIQHDGTEDEYKPAFLNRSLSSPFHTDGRNATFM